MDSITLTQEALRLDVVEKVHLIDALWSSLDSSKQGGIDLAWLHESQSRLIAYQDNQLVAIDGQGVLAEIESSL